MRSLIGWSVSSARAILRTIDMSFAIVLNSAIPLIAAVVVSTFRVLIIILVTMFDVLGNIINVMHLCLRIPFPLQQISVHSNPCQYYPDVGYTTMKTIASNNMFILLLLT